MSNIRNFIESQLLEPLRLYPTVIQHTMIEIIIDRLDKLYEYSIKFPEIISPNKNRLDILRAIADQFVFTVRNDADLQEQIDILEHILYVYRKRGSVDTIENMWKYYGGNLPKDVEVFIPSYNLFRYSVSTYSGTHLYQDNLGNRTGVYEVKLTNNTYPISELKEFMLKELVAAGNRIYFTNRMHMEILSKDGAIVNPYSYNIYKDTLHFIQMEVMQHEGFTFSTDKGAFSGVSTLSGDLVLLFWITFRRDMSLVRLESYEDLEIILDTLRDFSPYTLTTTEPEDWDTNYNNYYIKDENDKYIKLNEESAPGWEPDTYYRKEDAVRYNIAVKQNYAKMLESLVMYCTPTDPEPLIAHYLHNNQGEYEYEGEKWSLITQVDYLTEDGFKYFILNRTLLGEGIDE